MSEATPGELPAGASLCSLAYPLALLSEKKRKRWRLQLQNCPSANVGALQQTARRHTACTQERSRLTASRDRRGLRGEVWQDAGYPKGNGAPGADSAALCSHWLTLAGTHPRSGPLLGARESQAASQARGSCLGII